MRCFLVCSLSVDESAIASRRLGQLDQAGERMRRFLVVANQTIGGDQLAAAVRDRVSAGDCAFYVVVPATPRQDQVGFLGSEAGPTKAPSPEEHAYAIASQRLDAAIEEIRGAGGVAGGEVGDAEPLEAIRQALSENPTDEIIISTLPVGLSKWLRRDLPTQVRRMSGLPVTHVVSQELSSR